LENKTFDETKTDKAKSIFLKMQFQFKGPKYYFKDINKAFLEKLRHLSDLFYD